MTQASVRQARRQRLLRGGLGGLGCWCGFGSGRRERLQKGLASVSASVAGLDQLFERSFAERLVCHLNALLRLAQSANVAGRTYTIACHDDDTVNGKGQSSPALSVAIRRRAVAIRRLQSSLASTSSWDAGDYTEYNSRRLSQRRELLKLHSARARRQRNFPPPPPCIMSSPAGGPTVAPAPLPTGPPAALQCYTPVHHHSTITVPPEAGEVIRPGMQAACPPACQNITNS